MSELREELERQFVARGLIEPKSEIDATKENSSDNTEIISEETVGNVEAPASFDKKFADDFKNLPLEWQRYLCAHEEEYNKAATQMRDELQGYAWVEKIFAAHRDRLHQAGIEKLERWLEGLATIDANLQQNPVETLNAIAVCYGIKPSSNNATVSSPITQEVIARLCDLERDYHRMQEHLQQERYQRLVDMVSMFACQTDDNGQPMHPYFEEVKQQVYGLLLNGTASDVSDAYEKALWMHPAVREQLIQNKISSQAAEVQKAKQASFAPKGKTEVPERELTLREEIEKNMAAFMD